MSGLEVNSITPDNVAGNTITGIVGQSAVTQTPIVLDSAIAVEVDAATANPMAKRLWVKEFSDFVKRNSAAVSPVIGTKRRQDKKNNNSNNNRPEFTLSPNVSVNLKNITVMLSMFKRLDSAFNRGLVPLSSQERNTLNRLRMRAPHPKTGQYNNLKKTVVIGTHDMRSAKIVDSMAKDERQVIHDMSESVKLAPSLSLATKTSPHIKRQRGNKPKTQEYAKLNALLMASMIGPEPMPSAPADDYKPRKFGNSLTYG